jgi:hypothetical protein
MLGFVRKNALLLVVGSALFVSGCATTEDVERAQATANEALMRADQANAAAQASMGAAQQAQQTANAATAQAQDAARLASEANAEAQAAQAAAEQAARPPVQTVFARGERG